MPRRNASVAPRAKRRIEDHGPSADWRKARAERATRDERQAATTERKLKQERRDDE